MVEVTLQSDKFFSIKRLNGTSMWLSVEELDSLIEQLSDLKAKLDKSKLAEREREKLVKWQGVVR